MGIQEMAFDIFKILIKRRLSEIEVNDDLKMSVHLGFCSREDALLSFTMVEEFLNTEKEKYEELDYGNS